MYINKLMHVVLAFFAAMYVSTAYCSPNHGQDNTVEKPKPENSHAHGQTEKYQAPAEEINLSAAQIALANIEVNRLVKKRYTSQLYAPAEVKANGYASYIASPRVDSVVIKRHALLGQHIEKGAALVTLFSAQVATAQTQYRLTAREWQRLNKMSKGTVSEKQLYTAKAEFEVAYSQLVAFGLSTQAIKETLSEAPANLGEYTLFAKTSGAVLRDNFSQGQRVDAGSELMMIADESKLWVEAQLSASQDREITSGSEANIVVNNKQYRAYVIQEAHTINETTRSRIVRLSVENTDHVLHPGMFADVYFNFMSTNALLAVPESALSRSADGDWQVFVQDEDGGFIATEVTLGQRFGQYRQIQGLQQGTQVVTKGAFFVASQLAKGGFDPHNH